MVMYVTEVKTELIAMARIRCRAGGHAAVARRSEAAATGFRRAFGWRRSRCRSGCFRPAGQGAQHRVRASRDARDARQIQLR
jgi:hypothetical protein